MGQSSDGAKTALSPSVNLAQKNRIYANFNLGFIMGPACDSPKTALSPTVNLVQKNTIYANFYKDSTWVSLATVERYMTVNRII